MPLFYIVYESEFIKQNKTNSKSLLKSRRSVRNRKGRETEAMEKEGDRKGNGEAGMAIYLGTSYLPIYSVYTTFYLFIIGKEESREEKNIQHFCKIMWYELSVMLPAWYLSGVYLYYTLSSPGGD